MEPSTERQREILRQNLDQLTEQRWGRQRDLRGWQRMLERALSEKGLRAGRTVKSVNAEAQRECRKQVAQCEFDIERLEIAIEDAEADLSLIEGEE